MIRLIENGIKHKGFSMIEGLSVCPTYYGRKNKKGSAVDMYNWQKDHCIDILMDEIPDTMADCVRQASDDCAVAAIRIKK